MTQTIQLLNSLKAKTGAASDYALAKKLDMTRSAISNYQNGRRILDDETAVKVASMLEIDPSIVLASIHIERAKTEAEKRTWIDIFERLGGVAATVLFGIMLNAPTDAKANESLSARNKLHNEHSINYTKRRRKAKSYNPLEMLVNQLLSIA